MNWIKNTVLLFVCFTLVLPAISQRRLTEATLTYSITMNSGNGSGEILKDASSVVYLKGPSSRAEMISTLGVQSTIVDGKSKNVTVLKDYGAQKYMIKMTPEEWTEMNQRFENVTFTYTEEYKTIQGYNCQKAIGKMSDGKTFDVYFTKELVPINKDFQYINRNLPGLAVQYDASLGDLSVTYTLTKIDFKPVPQAKFDIPSSGYRTITYEESKGQ